MLLQSTFVISSFKKGSLVIKLNKINSYSCYSIGSSYSYLYSLYLKLLAYLYIIYFNITFYTYILIFLNLKYYLIYYIVFQILQCLLSLYIQTDFTILLYKFFNT